MSILRRTAGFGCFLSYRVLESFALTHLVELWFLVFVSQRQRKHGLRALDTGGAGKARGPWQVLIVPVRLPGKH